MKSREASYHFCPTISFLLLQISSIHIKDTFYLSYLAKKSSFLYSSTAYITYWHFTCNNCYVTKADSFATVILLINIIVKYIFIIQNFILSTRSQWEISRTQLQDVTKTGLEAATYRWEVCRASIAPHRQNTSPLSSHHQTKQQTNHCRITVLAVNYCCLLSIYCLLLLRLLSLLFWDSNDKIAMI